MPMLTRSKQVQCLSLISQGCDLQSANSSRAFFVSPVSFLSSQTTSTFVSQKDKIPCPFKGYDGCHGGVDGNGYARSAIYKHLTDMHFPTMGDKDT